MLPLVCTINLNLTCCDNGCLLRHGLCNIKRIIRQQRDLLYKKQYNEQNYLLSKLVEVKITQTGKRKITYKSPSLGEVCKTAFLKVYGISKHKIECLLKKNEPWRAIYRARPKRANHSWKTFAWNKKTVIDFILSYDASESHYRKSRSGSKKYFDSNESLRKMWSKYIREHPDVKTTSLKRKKQRTCHKFLNF